MATTEETNQVSFAQTLDSFDLAEDADVCGANGCRETEELLAVTPEDRGTRVLCSSHAKHYMGVSS